MYNFNSNVFDWLNEYLKTSNAIYVDCSCKALKLLCSLRLVLLGCKKTKSSFEIMTNVIYDELLVHIAWCHVICKYCL